ncbi:MAG: hypothetical protein JW782_07225 [Candidatus Saganbacteria bacterium]|nr:hypothetical protein [Candidatus Saganbacteria bacterium]
MRIFSAKMTRRNFLFLSAAMALSSCRCRPWREGTAPAEVLDDLRANPVIGRLRNGEIIFLHKDLEALTANGKNALTIIQRGLFALGLIKGDMDDFNFGVYGPSTAQGIRRLQGWAGIAPEQGWAGRRFERMSLLALEAALEQSASNHWRPPADI